MTDQWIVIPNWDKFQHYHDRNPVWIKLYTDLGSNDEWCRLSNAERGLLTFIWVEYARSRGVVDTSQIRRRSGAGTKQALIKALANAGFIELSASKPLALRYQDASPEKEKEKRRTTAPAKEAVDKSPPARAPTPNSGLLARFDAWVKYEGFEYVDDADAFTDELRRRKFILDAKAPLAGELLDRARSQVHA